MNYAKIIFQVRIYYILDYINHDNIRYNTINFEKPKEKYIIIELMGKENDKKALHILSFINKNKLSIGRGLNVDMRIPEISVSRFHASI